jgi:hypothetical protein
MEADRAAFNEQQKLRQALLEANKKRELQALNATILGKNKLLSEFGNLAAGSTQSQLNLTGQRLGANLALANAEAAARQNRIANMTNAFTTFTSDLTAGADDLMKLLKLVG